MFNKITRRKGFDIDKTVNLLITTKEKEAGRKDIIIKLLTTRRGGLVKPRTEWITRLNNCKDIDFPI